MADRPPDDVEDLEDREEGPADQGRILAPEELDISESEHVEELEEGRFVVSPDGPPNVGPEQRDQSKSASQSGGKTPESPRDDTPADFTQQSRPQDQQQPASRQPQHHQQQQGGQHTTLTQEQVHQWLKQDFEANSSTYAFDVTATFEGTVSQRRMASNDVVTIFESLILWYAQQVDNNTPVEEVLGILLMESNVPVRYPPQSIHELVKSSDLGPDDSIGELLEEIDDGVQF